MAPEVLSRLQLESVCHSAHSQWRRFWAASLQSSLNPAAAMIVENLFLIAYGVISFVGIYLVIYLGLPTHCLAGVTASILYGDDTVASAVGGDGPSSRCCRRAGEGQVF